MAFDSQNRLARAIGVAGVLAALLLAPHPLRAQTQIPLYSFCSQGNPCDDGAVPYASLVQSSVNDQLYGTTANGGLAGDGTIFAITLSGTESVVWSFCLAALTGSSTCPDGQNPIGPLIQDSQGNLYGTTENGGAYGKGTVFEYLQNPPSGQSPLLTLYSFCSQGGSNCTDGAYPSGALAFDSAGNLYGTTSGYGEYFSGTIFEINPASPSSPPTIYSFGAQADDGAYPAGGLVLGSDGNLYGTTSGGGASAFGEGTVFEFAPGLSEPPNILYSFCTSNNIPCPDGSEPYAPLFQGQGGLLYGTTYTGGVVSNQVSNYGTIFSITPYSPTASSTFSQIYVFCQNYTGETCVDGNNPYAGVIQGSDGNLYGTTLYGGSNGAYSQYSGTVFQFNLSNSTLTTLYSFCVEGGLCVDGELPGGGLLQASNGQFYGTTEEGGAYGRGTVFSLGMTSAVSVSETTPAGNDVSTMLTLPDGGPTVTLTFPNGVSQTGTTTVTASTACSTNPPADVSVGLLGGTGECIDVTTTANYSPYIVITMTFNPAYFSSSSPPVMFHYSGGTWVNVTTSWSFANDTITGIVNSLSPFGVFVGLPAASLASSSLTFSPQTVGTSSAQTVTLTNPGYAPLAIQSISTGGDFFQTNTCGATLAAGASCAISVTFTAQGTGTITGTLSIFDNAAGSPQTVMLSGTGVTFTSGPITPLPLPPPPGTVEPGQPVNPPTASGGGASAPKGAPGREIIPSHSNLVPLAPAATTITAAPATAPSAPALKFSSLKVTFPAQAVGTSSGAQTIMLTNSSDVPLVISSITAGDDFSQTNDCKESVAAGDSCTIKVTFKPTATDARTGTLTINEGAPGSTQTIPLSGTGRPVEP